MLRNIRFILTAFALGAVLAPSMAQADEACQSNGAQPTGGPGMHGPLGLVHAALKEPIGLSSQQRATIEASLASLHPSAREEAAHASHRAALVAQIRAGVVDETALAMPAPTSDERAAHDAAAAAAITTLHDTLTAAQRSVLVSAVTAEHSAPPGAEQHQRGGPMQMFEGLGLSDAQQTAVRTALESGRPDAATMRARFDAMRADHDAKMQSFVGSSFDARAFVAPPAGAPQPDGRPDRMVHDLATVVPLLTTAQREALAQRIEAGPHAAPTQT